MNPGKQRIMLIDFWNIMIAQNAVANILDMNTNQCGMYLTTLNQCKNFIDIYKPKKVIIAMDGPNAGERRRQIYKGYKKGSKVKASSVILQDDEDSFTKYSSQQAFAHQLVKLYNFMKLLPVTVVMVPYCEGDDIIAYLTMKNKEEFDVIVVSGDKDYCQLIDDNVSVYNWREKRHYGRTTFKEKYNILSENHIYMKILLGDASDNVKGVKGIGKGTFPIFHEMLSAKPYEGIMEFVDATKEMDQTGLNTKQKNALKNLWSEDTVEEMFLLWQVMRLDENCLKLQHIEALREQVEEQMDKGLQRMAASQMMVDHEFNKLGFGFSRERWLQPFSFIKPEFKINT